MIFYKKYVFLLIVTFVLVSCKNSTTNTAQQTVSFFSAWDTLLEQTIEKNFASVFSVETPKMQNINYSQALSEQELQQLKDMARNYYKNEFSYDLLSLKVAENNCHWYDMYSQYQEGNIIIFQAETTHAGEGIYRYIAFARENTNQQWEQINEGY